MTQPTCKTCRFWKPTHKDLGECCIRAPSIVSAITTDLLKDEDTDDFHDVMWLSTRFPLTSAFFWCGEHEPRKASK